MSIQAQIVRAWQNSTHVHLAVRVTGEGPAINGTQVDIEYVGKVHLDDLAGLTGAQIKLALIAAVQAERANNLVRLSSNEQDIPALTGTVQI